VHAADAVRCEDDLVGNLVGGGQHLRRLPGPAGRGGGVQDRAVPGAIVHPHRMHAVEGVHHQSGLRGEARGRGDGGGRAPNAVGASDTVDDLAFPAGDILPQHMQPAVAAESGGGVERVAARLRDDHRGAPGSIHVAGHIAHPKGVQVQIVVKNEMNASLRIGHRGTAAVGEGGVHLQRGHLDKVGFPLRGAGDRRKNPRRDREDEKDAGGSHGNLTRRTGERFVFRMRAK
jgi:hypothetical protein